MNELPSGWEWTTLGAIGRYVNGYPFKPSDWSPSGRPIIRIQNLTGNSSAFNYFAGEPDPRHVVRDGDLLISWSATLGAYFWHGPEAVLNQHIFKVESFIDPRFHKYLVDHALAALFRKTHGSGIVHITRKPFDEHPVALPPVAEQQRIVDAIEEGLSRIQAGVQALDGANLRCTALVHSSVKMLALEASAASARAHQPVGDLLAQPLANGRSVPDGPSGGYPVLRLSSVRDGRVDVTVAKQGAWDAKQAAPFIVRAGDFLVVRGNGSKNLVGRGGVVMTDAPVAFPDTLIRLRPSAQLRPKFLALIWDSQAVREQLEGRARTTAGIYKISQQDIAAVRLPVPSLGEQDALIERTETSIGAARRGATAVRTAMKDADRLRSTVLAAAFKGALIRA